MLWTTFDFSMSSNLNKLEAACHTKQLCEEKLVFTRFQNLFGSELLFLACIANQWGFVPKSTTAFMDLSIIIGSKCLALML